MVAQAEFLVTGGAGFIGSNIVRRLLREERAVRVLDDLSSGRASNLDDILGQIEFIEGDIRDAETAQQAVSGVRNVLHLAALPSVIRSVENPKGSNDVNINGTLNMLVAARDAGVSRFVFSSSSSVYGNSATLPKQEAMPPNPLSPYAAQKLTGEHYCRIFRDLYGLPTFALRYFNVFGPRQNPKSQYAAVIPLFADAIRNGRAPVIHGDGLQTRDFTFVEDVAAANLACCAADESASGTVYNVCRGDRVSILDLANMIGDILGKPFEAVHVETRAGDVRDSQGDCSRAVEALGWQGRVGLREGLGATLEYLTAEAAGAGR